MKFLTTLFPLLVLFFTMKAGAQNSHDVEQPAATEHALSGWSTAIYGGHAVVASPQKDSGDQLSVGEVTFYSYSDGSWNLSEVVQPGGLPALSNFGHDVALYGETAAVSSFGNNQKGLFSGSVYLYDFDGNGWNNSTILNGSDTEIGHRFGYSIDLHGSLLVAGAYLGSGAEEKSGAAYLFEKFDGEWIETAKLVAEDGQTGDYFGYTTHFINENTVAIGAYKAEGAEVQTGAVYIFSRTEEGWEQSSKLTDPNGDATDLFGYSLASVSIPVEMENEHHILFAGAPGVTGENGKTGAVFAYSHTEEGWIPASTIMKEDIDINSHFGISIAGNHENMIYIGASRNHSGSDRETGSVFAYEIEISDNGPSILPETEITAGQKESFEQFGAVISASNEFLLISSPFTNRDDKVNSGRVHFYSDLAVSVDDDGQEITEFALKQNYPNPFNPATTIQYKLPESSDVRLEVFDMIGRRVAILVNEQVEAGHHEIYFDASHLASGVYIYRMIAGDRTFTQKLTLIK